MFVLVWGQLSSGFWHLRGQRGLLNRNNILLWVHSEHWILNRVRSGHQRFNRKENTVILVAVLTGSSTCKALAAAARTDRSITVVKAFIFMQTAETWGPIKRSRIRYLWAMITYSLLDDAHEYPHVYYGNFYWAVHGQIGKPMPCSSANWSASVHCLASSSLILIYIECNDVLSCILPCAFYFTIYSVRLVMTLHIL